MHKHLELVAQDVRKSSNAQALQRAFYLFHPLAGDVKADDGVKDTGSAGGCPAWGSLTVPALLFYADPVADGKLLVYKDGTYATADGKKGLATEKDLLPLSVVYFCLWCPSRHRIMGEGPQESFCPFCK
ncbi:MAG: hypothetical protein R2830_15750 [Saprospiraceae bacterium]